MHADISLSEAVANADDSKLHRRSAVGIDAPFDIFRDLVQIKMSRDDGIPGVCDSDQRAIALEFEVRKAHRFEEGKLTDIRRLQDFLTA